MGDIDPSGFKRGACTKCDCDGYERIKNGPENCRICRHNSSKHACLSEKKEHDSEFKGPLSSRSRQCRDIPCCMLFLLFWLGMFIVASVAYSIGNPNRLLYGTDSYGNVCNYDNTFREGGVDMRGKEFLFFGNPTDPKQAEVCVEACPTYGPDPIDLVLLDPQNVFCVSNFTGYPTVDDVWLPLPGFDEMLPCYHGYASSPVLRRCVPVVNENSTLGEGVESAMSEVNAVDTITVVLGDLNDAKYMILACCFLALSLSFLFLTCLRFFAGCMVYVTLIIIMIVLCTITGFLFYQANDAKTKYDAAVVDGTATDRMSYNSKALIGLATIAAVVTAGVACFLCFMFTKIRETVAIIKEASIAVQAMPLIVFFPIVIFIFLAAFFAYWLAVWMFVGTAGYATYDESTGRFLGYEADRTIKSLQFYHIFGFFWTTQFLIAIGQCTIAGAVAQWYFCVDKYNDLPEFPIFGAFARTLQYHLGSLAFGSLLIAIVQMARFTLEYIDRTTQGKDNCLVNFVLKCMKCCLWCLEKFMKFISRNAYIQIAIYGESFFQACKSSFHLLANNSLRLATVQFIGDAMLFLGKISITVTVTFVAIITLRDNPLLEFYAIPVIVIFLLSYAIASAFMGVYELGIDTIFMAFCDDCERNSGDDQAYWMSPRLAKFRTEREPKKKPDLAAASPPNNGSDEKTKL